MNRHKNQRGSILRGLTIAVATCLFSCWLGLPVNGQGRVPYPEWASSPQPVLQEEGNGTLRRELSAEAITSFEEWLGRPFDRYDLLFRPYEFRSIQFLPYPNESDSITWRRDSGILAIVPRKTDLSADEKFSSSKSYGLDTGLETINRVQSSQFAGRAIPHRLDESSLLGHLDALICGTDHDNRTVVMIWRRSDDSFHIIHRHAEGPRYVYARINGRALHVFDLKTRSTRRFIDRNFDGYYESRDLGFDEESGGRWTMSNPGATVRLFSDN